MQVSLLPFARENARLDRVGRKENRPEIHRLTRHLSGSQLDFAPGRACHKTPESRSKYQAILSLRADQTSSLTSTPDLILYHFSRIFLFPLNRSTFPRLFPSELTRTGRLFLILTT